MRGVPLVAGTWSQCGWAGRLLRLKLESFEKASEVHARQKQPKLPVLFSAAMARVQPYRPLSARPGEQTKSNLSIRSSCECGDDS
jgi:hypothetical protein